MSDGRATLPYSVPNAGQPCDPFLAAAFRLAQDRVPAQTLVHADKWYGPV